MVLRINLRSTHDSDVLLCLATVSSFWPACPSIPAAMVFQSNRSIFVPSTLTGSLLPAHPLVGSFSFLKFQLKCCRPRKSLSDSTNADSPGARDLARCLFVMSLSLTCKAVTSSGPQQITDRPPRTGPSRTFIFTKAWGKTTKGYIALGLTIVKLLPFGGPQNERREQLPEPRSQVQSASLQGAAATLQLRDTSNRTSL